MNDIRRYAIVRNKHSSNFMVFPTATEAWQYVQSSENELPLTQKELYVEECYDPFMTFEKFYKLPEFSGF